MGAKYLAEVAQAIFHNSFGAFRSLPNKRAARFRGKRDIGVEICACHVSSASLESESRIKVLQYLRKCFTVNYMENVCLSF